MDIEGEIVDFTSCLPDELLLRVLSYVDFKDLCRLGCVCRRLRCLFHSDILWRRLCHIYWVLDISSNTGEDAANNWYTIFIDWYRKVGQFIDCYAIIKRYWNRIEASLKEKGANDILESLNGPIISQIDQLSSQENTIGIPLDLLCSLHIHNGQAIPLVDEEARLLGLAGTLKLYDYSSCPSLLSYEEILTAIQENHHDYPETNLKTLTVLRCPFNRTTVRMCLESSGEVQRGFMFYRQRGLMLYRQDNVTHNLFHGMTHKGFYLSAESFTDWLAELADKLSNSATIIYRGGIFRFVHEPSCIAVTEDVKVTVAANFVPELSQTLIRPRRMFSYHLTMEMDKDVHPKKSCKLLTRYWEVTDGNGKVEVVAGDGVIGTFPIIKPGTSYSWTSCTLFDTISGSMRGHFGMINLQTQELFDVKCPEFHMESLPFLRLPVDLES